MSVTSSRSLSLEGFPCCSLSPSLYNHEISLCNILVVHSIDRSKSLITTVGEFNKMVDCKVFSEQRFKCHAVYGKGGEDCLHQELSEKRCLSLYHCPRQAFEYYGDFPMTIPSTNNTSKDVRNSNHAHTHTHTHTIIESTSGQSSCSLTNKALCASWAESFAYADKEMEYGKDVADHHRQAREVVAKDRGLKRDCRQIAFDLAQCLRQKKLA